MYESIYSNIGSKEAEAKKQLTELERPTPFRTQQFKDPSVWAEERKLRQQHIAYGQQKKEAVKQTKRYLHELGEHRSKVEEYKREGYIVESSEEGEHRFSKKVYHPGRRVAVGGGREQSVMVYWVNPKTGQTGSFQGTNTNMSSYERQLSSSGRSITKVTTVGGGQQYKTEAGHYTTEDVVLAEAKPVYEKVPFEPVKYDEKKIGDVTVRHIGMDKEPVDLGFGKQVRVQETTSDAELAMIRQSDISRTDVVRELTKAKIVGYEKYEKWKEGIKESFSFKKGDPGKASVKFLSSFALSAPSYFLSLPSVLSGEQTALDVYASISMGSERAMKRGGMPEVFLQSYTDPMGTGRFFTEIAATSYAMGAGMGALKKTVWGAKTLVRSRGIWSSTKHGKVFTRLFKPEVGKPIWQISRSKVAEMSIAGYYTKDIPKQAVEYPFETGISLGMSLPLVGTFYKAGHRYGGSVVQRWGGMSRVSGLQRVQQHAIYDSIDIVQSLKGVPKKKGFVFDLTSVKKIGKTKAEQLGTFIRGERWKRTRPTIMGSTSMEFFDVSYSPLPKSTQSWITSRLKRGGHKVGLIGDRPPMDLDLGLHNTLFRDVGKRFYNMFPKKEFSHIIEKTHGSPKAGRELYPGYGGYELFKSKVKIKGVSFKVRAMKPLEQFFRTSRSIAPSEWVDYKTPGGIIQSSQEYRLGKDVQRWWNIGQATAQQNLKSMFYKGKAQKLLDAMQRYTQPSKHKIPSVSFGERFLKRIGGDVKPTGYKMDMRTGGYYPVYPSSVYPSKIMSYMMGGYPSRTYPGKLTSGKYPLLKQKPYQLFPTKKKIIPPIVPPPTTPYAPIPYKPTPPPPYAPPPRETSKPAPPIVLFGKDVLPPSSTFKFEEPVVKIRKKKRVDVFPGKRKTLKGLSKVVVPEYRFRMFDVGSLFKGAKI